MYHINFNNNINHFAGGVHCAHAQNKLHETRNWFQDNSYAFEKTHAARKISMANDPNRSNFGSRVQSSYNKGITAQRSIISLYQSYSRNYFSYGLRQISKAPNWIKKILTHFVVEI